MYYIQSRVRNCTEYCYQLCKRSEEDENAPAPKSNEPEFNLSPFQRILKYVRFLYPRCETSTNCEGWKCGEGQPGLVPGEEHLRSVEGVVHTSII